MSEWIAYRSIELLPDERIELLLASIATLLANQWRGEDDTPATPADFMPWLPEDDDDDKCTDMVAMIEQLNMVFGGDDLRSPRDPDLAAAIAEGALELIDPLRRAEQDEYTYPWEP